MNANPSEDDHTSPFNTTQLGVVQEELEVNMKVSVKDAYDPNNYLPGSIVAIDPDGTYTIRFDRSGDKQSDVPRDSLKVDIAHAHMSADTRIIGAHIETMYDLFSQGQFRTLHDACIRLHQQTTAKRQGPKLCRLEQNISTSNVTEQDRPSAQFLETLDLVRPLAAYISHTSKHAYIHICTRRATYVHVCAWFFQPRIHLCI